MNAIGVAQFQRYALEQVSRACADRTHQLERFPIGADEDVLAVVERDFAGARAFIEADPSRPTAKVARCLEQRDADTLADQCHAGGEARPAGADDCDIVINPGHWSLCSVDKRYKYDQ